MRARTSKVLQCTNHNTDSCPSSSEPLRNGTSWHQRQQKTALKSVTRACWINKLFFFPLFFFVCAIRQVFCFLPRSVYTNSQHSFCVSSVIKEHQLFFMQWWHSTTTITERKKAAVLDGKKKKMKQNWLLQVPAFWSKIRTHERWNRTLILIRRYKMCANVQGRCEQTIFSKWWEKWNLI